MDRGGRRLALRGVRRVNRVGPERVLTRGDAAVMGLLYHQETSAIAPSLADAAPQAALRSGLPVFATCAGMILLAERVENPQQRSYALLPITVVRNGYGRQLHSGTFAHESTVLPAGTTGTFIRAPRITAVGDCEVLARRDGDPVLVRKGPLLAACFHPELALRHPVCARFAAMVREQEAAPAPAAAMMA